MMGKITFCWHTQDITGNEMYKKRPKKRSLKYMFWDSELTIISMTPPSNHLLMKLCFISSLMLSAFAC